MGVNLIVTKAKGFLCQKINKLINKTKKTPVFATVRAITHEPCHL